MAFNVDTQSYTEDVFKFAKSGEKFGILDMEGNFMTFGGGNDYFIQPRMLLVKNSLGSKTISYVNDSDEDIYCMFSILSFKGSISGDTNTLSGCDLIQDYYYSNGGLVSRFSYIKIPARSEFKSVCTWEPDIVFHAALVRIK